MFSPGSSHTVPLVGTPGPCGDPQLGLTDWCFPGARGRGHTGRSVVSTLSSRCPPENRVCLASPKALPPTGARGPRKWGWGTRGHSPWTKRPQQHRVGGAWRGHLLVAPRARGQPHDVSGGPWGTLISFFWPSVAQVGIGALVHPRSSLREGLLQGQWQGLQESPPALAWAPA